jgi:fucose permease
VVVRRRRSIRQPGQLSPVPATVIFLVNGTLYANWVPRIPTVKAELGLAEDELGLALLCVALGLLLAQPVAALLHGRVDSRALTGIGVVACCVWLPLPAYASSLGWLAVGLFGLGFANGVLDVSMNTYAVALEHRVGRPIMAFLHGSVSIGIVVGGLFGAAAAALAVPPHAHLTAAAAGLLMVSGVAWWRLPDVSGVAVPGEAPARRFPRRVLPALGVMGFSCLLAEGAVADWGAVYLVESLNASAGLAGAGFIGFMALMTVGRLIGDRVETRWGATRLARSGALLAILGLLIAVTSHNLALSVAGFTVMGAGLSCIFPLVLRSAAQIAGMPPATGIAIVSTSGYVGFVAGPALIGSLAVEVGLSAALLVAAVCLMSVVVRANSLATPVKRRGERFRFTATRF